MLNFNQLIDITSSLENLPEATIYSATCTSHQFTVKSSIFVFMFVYSVTREGRLLQFSIFPYSEVMVEGLRFRTSCYSNTTDFTAQTASR